MADPRIEWLGTKVVEILEVEKGLWDDLVKSNEAFSNDAKDFFEKGQQKQTLFIYNAVQVETHEEEVFEPNPAYDAPAGGEDGAKHMTEPNPTPKAIRKVVTTHSEKSVLTYSIGSFEQPGDTAACWFTRNSDAKITDASAMAASLSTGCLNGRFLLDLKVLLQNLVMPMLDTEGPSGADASDGQKSKSAVGLSASNVEEISAASSRFLVHVSQAANQVYGNVNIKLPPIDLDDLNDPHKKNQLVSLLLQHMEEWSGIIRNILEDESKRQRTTSHPMAEIEFWRDRSSKVSTLYEQLQLPAVQKAVNALNSMTITSSDAERITSHFHEQYGELSRMHVEAKDNVKFLTTLERHFKNLHSGSMNTIVETLPSLLNAIRMVWIISRYFNTDEYMEPLMKRIADQVADKVEETINVQTIFDYEPQKAMQIISDGKAALDKWKTTYMDTRDRIEESGTDHRWEFDRPKLFKKTEYMSKICHDLYEIAHVLDQFYKFLGPELKEVTGDSHGIDQLLDSVRSLTSGFKTIPQVFEDRFRNTWDTFFANFKEQVEKIEKKATAFLDKSFQKLRSAEGAFQLLRKFKNIESRDKINKKMNEKFVDILTQYNHEVCRMRALFKKGVEMPPISKNSPPVSGSIMWARSIFHRVKRPVLSFKTMPNLLESQQGQDACRDYVDLGKEILAYEQSQFDGWIANAEKIAEDALKLNILRQEGHKYFVNFSPELTLLVREAKYLDQMGGFELPHVVLNVALQQDKYQEFSVQLQVLLDSYSAVVDDLTPVQKKLLAKQIQKLEKCLKPGLSPLNWNSLGILEFIEDCQKGVSEFRSVRDQVEKSEERIDALIVSIEKAQLVRDFDWTRADVMDIQELSEYFEKHRAAVVKDLVTKYEWMSPLLIKVEETTVGTKSGCAPSMFEYYHYWERKVFNAIQTMIASALSSFQVLLAPQGPEGLQKPPLFKWRMSFSPGSDNGVEMTSTAAFASKTSALHNIEKNIVTSSKNFIRWMNGTCRIDAALKDATEEMQEKIPCNFYYDIERSAANIEIKRQIMHNMQTVLKEIKAMEAGLITKHSFIFSSKAMADSDKLTAFSRDEGSSSSAQAPTLAKFESWITFGRDLASQVAFLPTERDIGFVRVDCSAVIQGIQARAMEVSNSYGKVLNSIAHKDLSATQDKINDLTLLMEDQPKDLESLKKVLQGIAIVRSTSMEQELKILDIQEQYRTLAMFTIEDASASSHQASEALLGEWKDLKDKALTKDKRMLAVKKKFAEITSNDAIAFGEGCKEAFQTFLSEGPGVEGCPLDEGLLRLQSSVQELQSLKRKREELVNAQQLFSLAVSSYPELGFLERDIDKLKKIYNLYQAYSDGLSDHASTLWHDVDVTILEKFAEDNERNVKKLEKSNPECKDTATYALLLDTVKGFSASVPLIRSLKHPSIQRVHWEEELSNLAGFQGECDPAKFKLSFVIGLQLHRYIEEVNEICVTAQNELKIQQDLEAISLQWHNSAEGELKMFQYKPDMPVMVLGANEDLKVNLEDNLLTLGSMKASKYAAKKYAAIAALEQVLNTVDEVMEAWLNVQRKWQYLESIFVSADIRNQLQGEAKRFDAADKQVKEMLKEAEKEKKAVTVMGKEGRLGVLEKIFSDLDSIQKSLIDYLNKKRSLFPRFYFISDDELISILGSSDPHSIQEHMLKLFDNCQHLTFDQNTATGMISSESEKFKFHETVKCAEPGEFENVECWMTQIDESMQETLLRVMKEGVYSYGSMERFPWIKLQLGMIALAGSQIWWTWGVEDIFDQVKSGNKNAMKDELHKESMQLQDLVVEVGKGAMPGLLRKSVNTLVIIDVHARDIIDRFVRDSVLEKHDFAWESQLRFYWDRREDNIVVKQCTGKFHYCYEYQGLNGRLVITPLTDRCVMTLTTALSFRMGGSPAGPAGTGKTETVKDLAKSLAIRCVVTNCGEGLDYKAMGAIFEGLCENGFWGCFDEFNRINVEVLSVVATQIKTIQHGLAMGSEAITLVGTRSVKLRVSMGYFITMNPGYAGRTELPDNLKTLFRPVVMIVPDLQMICENMLMSEGFLGAKVLAKKMTILYKLAQGQLSQQYHYDFKLRALKSVLVMAGDLKRGSAGLPEDIVLFRALRDMNMPKFIQPDVPLFLGLLGDLFPGLDVPRESQPVMKEAVERCLEEKNMKSKYTDLFDLQVDKVLQLFETMLTRHTTMIVGQSGGGKSVVLSTLAEAQTKRKEDPVKTLLFVINPKMVPVDELYGVLDPETRDWTDGLLSSIFREINKPFSRNRPERRYIVYDGDVDALWVENMNSVMDDNRILTLPNGERIRLEKHCKMLYEVFDLQYASPATISRCGMVYVDDSNLGPGPYYERWLCGKANNPQLRDNLEDFYEKYVPACLDYVLKAKEDPDQRPGDPLPAEIPRSNLNHVQQLCHLFDSIVTGQDPKMDSIENVYIFCLVWSVGSVLREETRKQFVTFLRKLANKPGLPSKTSLYDEKFDNDKGTWIPWKELVPEMQNISPYADFNSIMVPTIDTTRYGWLLERFVQMKRPALFVGESGTAKTVTLQGALETFPEDKSSILNINFSSSTTSLWFQNTLEDQLEKKSGNTYGPKEAGKKLRIFIDDLSMPNIDTYGTQQPLALLKFVVERNELYSRETLALKKVVDCEYVSAMLPPGAGRNVIDPRVVSLYCCIGQTFPDQDTVEVIYKKILEFKFAEFTDTIREAARLLPKATMELQTECRVKLARTPAKFHYMFNLRDLSRVFGGLWLADPSRVDTQSKIVRMWRNECCRVYADKLISDEDRDVVRSQKLPDLIKSRFSQAASDALADPILFGDFADAVRILEEDERPWMGERLYDDLGDYSQVQAVCNKVLESYNEKCTQPMHLVLFNDAISHLCRVHRIIRLPRGNALLVGVGGSGKQSLTRLATFMAGYGWVCEISLTRGYKDEDFMEDLKSFFAPIPDKAKPVTFMFTDAHVAKESFLEFINNILTVGMVPGLFDETEQEEIKKKFSKLHPESTKNVAPTKLWKMTVDFLRNNFHLVLAMTPAGDTLRQRCRSFPGLVSCTTIDWFFAWPKSALLAVANFILGQEQNLPPESKDQVCDLCPEFHLSVTSVYGPEFEKKYKRRTFATPKNYLDFLAGYRTQLSTNGKLFDDSYKRLGDGLSKLSQAATEVSTLQQQLKEKKVVVDANQKEVTKLLEDIAEKSVVVEASMKQASESEKQIQEDSVIIVREKADADEALSAAIPALEAAASALDALDAKDISEVKGFVTPPPAVEIVCRCVNYLNPLGNMMSDDWAGAKTMLTNSNFLRSLKEYKKDEIHDRMIKKINVQLNNDQYKHYFVSYQSMVAVSKAGAGLLEWLKAMVKYHGVAKTVEPKRKLVKELQQRKEQAEESLKKTQKEVAELTEQITTLREQEKIKGAELERLVTEASEMSRRLDAAEKLIAGLGSEQIRWTADQAELGSKKERLVGDCLVNASFLSYAGPFNHEFRDMMVNSGWEKNPEDRSQTEFTSMSAWVAAALGANLPVSQPFRLPDLLTSDVEISKWSGEGLPSDELSVQNGILTTRSSRYPLCIDPQMQAVSWIKKKEKEHGLKVKTFNDGDFVKHLELALTYGQPFLFENLDEELDPMVDPVLEKNYTEENGQRVLKLGDNKIPVVDTFRLFMVTKLPNPRYTPEIMGKVSLVNYTVTLEGLGAQLLNVVVKYERPDLEKERENLVQTMSANRQALKATEDTLLYELANATGSILDNVELIKTLSDSKEQAVTISESLAKAEVTSAEIDKMRSAYKSISDRGSILYFAMVGLCAIESMYQYSLTSYLDVFDHSLREAKTEKITDNRVKNVINTLTKNVYDYTCTGIFSRHKVTFSLQMTIMIMRWKKAIDEQELEFFTKGNTSLASIDNSKKPAEWIQDSGWKDMQVLKEMEKFKPLLKSITENLDEWSTWYDLDAPEQATLPDGWDAKVTNFQKLMLMRVFRTDRVINSVKMFIEKEMDSAEYVKPPVLQYEKLYSQSTAKCPIVFILSPGADPQSDIRKLGAEKGFGGDEASKDKFQFVSLGQGMGPVAMGCCVEGAQRGRWVLLENCHLLTSWLKKLEKFIEQLQNPHKDFRLWLTTQPCEAFPMAILQTSLKVVTEPPDGLSRNLGQTYSRLSDNDLDCNHEAFKPLVFVLAFFHAIVQDRRKFGRIGWNVSYDFNESDFRISQDLLGLYLNKSYDKQEPIPWDTLRYLIGEAMYGGRVTDDFDRRVLSTYLEEYMGDFLFDENQQFFFSQQLSYDYKIPPTSNVANYLLSINGMPNVEAPGVFGLHPNAEITFLSNDAKDMWTNIINLQAGSAAGADSASKDEYVFGLADEILGKLPKEEMKFVPETVPTPAEVVLMQELERIIKLSSRMQASLIDLKRAINGEIGMSADLEELFNMIFAGFLPPQWARLAPQNTKPLGSWMEHYVERNRQYKRWTGNGLESQEPMVFWLSGLHVPQSLLSAIIQTMCRKNGWALDKSTMYTECTDVYDQHLIKERSPKGGTYVYGISIEGARWVEDDVDGKMVGRLARQLPKQLVCDMPIMEIIPAEANKVKLRDSLKTPVYTTPLRRNAMGIGLVFEADLNTPEHLSFWVLQGVALYLNTDF